MKWSNQFLKMKENNLADLEKLTKIEGIEDETAKELIERAKEFYQKDQEEISNRVKNLGLDNNLIELPGLTPGMLVTLGEKNILTLNDFAELAAYELTDKEEGIFRKLDLEEEIVNKMIMDARQKWFA